MEVVGLVVSISSLASVFETAVHCFQYIQLSKSFGSDVQTSFLRLDNAQLRLCRWGKALGLGTTTSNTASIAKTYTAQEVKQAEALLGHIINLFQNAEAISNKIKLEDGKSNMLEVTDLFTPQNMSLHQKMRDISLRRQKNASIARKAKWALYEKEHLDRLVDDVRALVDDLVGLFPSKEQIYNQLCNEEAAEFHNEAALPLLKDIAAQQDKLLEEAIARLLMPQSRTTHNTWHNQDNTKVLTQAGSITYHGGQSFSF